MFPLCRKFFSKGRHRRTAWLGVVLVVLALGATWPVGRRLWAGHHFRAARQALERRDFSAADAHLRACLNVWNDDADVHLLAARSARRQERYAEAQRHLVRCRNAKGADLEIALMRVQRGLSKDTEDYLKHTIAPDHPDVVLVLEALALGYTKTDRLADLLECTDLWLQVRPEDPQALFRRGYACERLRRADEARICYRRAIEADSVHDQARLHLGHLLLHRFKDADAACRQFEAVRQRQPDEPAVLLGLARCYRLLDRPDEAQEMLETIRSRHPQMPEAVSEGGQLALARGELSEAESCLRRAAILAPDDRETLYALIQCLNQRGQNDEVHAFSQRLSRLETDLARLELLIAEIGRKPDDADLRCEAGTICLRYEKQQEGLHWLHGALQVKPNHSASHATLAEHYERHGRADLASNHRRLAGKS